MYLCGLSYVPKASKVKKGEVGLKRRICRAQVKYRIYMLGTVHVSTQVFFTEMVISSSQICYKSFPSGTYLYPPARPDPWLLRVSGVIFAFLSLSSIWGILITVLVKMICGGAGPDDQELHLDTCWEMNWQWLQVRFVHG